MLGKLTAFSFSLIIFSQVAYPQSPKSGWQTYRSPDYGFTIDYPSNMKFFSGHPSIAEAQQSYIPICDESTVACFEYDGAEYKETNFQAAGLSVNILRDARTEQDCNKIDTGQFPIKTKTINGVSFHYGTTGSVGLSNGKSGPSYRAFYQNVCFEIAVGIAETSLGAYDPGAITAFNSTRLEKLLEEMVQTFRFTGAVKDGPAWKVYHDAMCGGDFEYPDSDSVVVSVEYTEESSKSDGFTCSRYFDHGGLRYTIANKGNLSEDYWLNSWLKRAGYPELSKTRTISKGRLYTEYDAGLYYYIAGQGGVYILGVSDGKHNPIVHEGDKIFQHLLSTFSVR